MGTEETIKRIQEIGQRLLDRLNAAKGKLAEIRAVVDQQAEDEALWFLEPTAAESYLQGELRRLHAIIEEATDDDQR